MPTFTTLSQFSHVISFVREISFSGVYQLNTSYGIDIDTSFCEDYVATSIPFLTKIPFFLKSKKVSLISFIKVPF